MQKRPSLSVLICVLTVIAGAAMAQMVPQQAPTSRLQPSDLIDRILAFDPPPPDWEAQARQRNASLPNSQRDWFEGKPADDAAADVLLAYWREHCWDDEIKPAELSDSLRRHILDATEQQPYDLMMVLRFLPETPDAATRVAPMYESAKKAGKPDNSEWFRRVLLWLVKHNQDYHGDLISLAEGARDNEFVSECGCPSTFWLDGDEALRALTDRDWPAARPILLKHADGDQPCVAALSLGLLCRHVALSGQRDEAAPFRERLKTIVENRAAPDLARTYACEALMATEWPGRDEWFLSLFADSSLSQTNYLDFLSWRPMGQPPTLLAVVRNDPDYWIPRVATLLGDRKRTIRRAALHCLAQFREENARVDVMRPLLPWLSNPKWVREDHNARERSWLIADLKRVKLPESIPGLTWIMEHEGEYQDMAAEALLFQQGKEVIPALKVVLARLPGGDRRSNLIKALLAAKGFDEDESVDAVETYAAGVASKGGKSLIRKSYHRLPEVPGSDAKAGTGYWIGINGWYREAPSNGVAKRLVARANELSRRDADLAETLWLIISHWGSKPIDAEVLRRLAAGDADEDSIRFALDRRKSFRGHVPEQLTALCEKDGSVLGVALVLLGDAKRYPAVLEGADVEAQRALLACARLIREPLPVPMVAELLKSKDERVSKAAWTYLRREDSPAARQVVLSRYPGQAKTLGWCPDYRDDKDPDDPSGFLGEEELRAAVLADDGPEEIYALLSFREFAGSIQRVIHVRGGKAELRINRLDCEFTPMRVTLSKRQWQDFKAFLTANSVDDLAPMDDLASDGVQYGYVHVTKGGGRRVYMNNPWTVGGSVYDRLVRRFEDLAEVPECTDRR